MKHVIKSSDQARFVDVICYSNITLRGTVVVMSSVVNFYTFFLLGHSQLVDIKGYLSTLGRATVTDLGLVLGVLFTTMRDLPNDDFLNRVITLWLDKADNVGSMGEPSWRALVKGLRHKQLHQNGIANRIAKDHCITDVQSQGRLPYCSVYMYIVGGLGPIFLFEDGCMAASS